MSIAKRRLIIFILLACFFAQSFISLSSKSATYDEVQHFGIGKYLLINQKWDVMGSILHPPLGYYILSIPLLFHDDDKRLWEYEEKNRDIGFLGAVDVVRGQGLLSAPENKNDRLLILCRLTVLLLSLLLGGYVYRFSSELFGNNAGLFSLFIFTFTPTILAFSGISTQDMPLTVFSFVSVYYFWRYLQNSSIRNALLAGLFLGMALAVKFTAMLLIPFELLLYCIYLFKARIRPHYSALLIVGIAVLIFLGSYGFNLTPFFQGNEYRLTEMKRGQAAFFNGQHSDFGWWYFYIATMMIKTPIPLLLLFLGSSLIFFRKTKEKMFTAVVLYFPVLFFLVLFSCSNFAVGIRYLLPVFPFVCVSVGVFFTSVSKRSLLFICCMSVWLVLGTVQVFPHYLAYFNELAGGADNGYKYLVDSNLDWGQDLKGLKKYMDKKGIRKVSLSYFGTDSPQRYGIEYDWLPSHHLYNPTPDKPLAIAQNQLIAISATNLQGVYLDNKNEFEWLRSHKPLAKIGYSIFLYDPQETIRNSRQ